MRSHLQRRSSCVPALLLLLLLPLPAGAGGLVPRLVRDVDQTSYAGSSSPRQSAYVGHGFSFTAFGNRELWVYDKMDDSFLRLLAAREIRQLLGSLYAQRGASGGWTLFQARGYPDPGIQVITRQPIARIGRTYVRREGGDWFFEGGDGRGPGLWTVDWANQRPVEVARPLPGPDGTLLRDLTAYRGKSYFVARHRDLGTALWVSDATPAGTFPVTAPAPGTSAPVFLAGVVRHRLLLAVSGEEPALWLSDGTARGTRRLLEIGHGRAGASLSDAVKIPDTNHVYFVADDGRTGKQLWVTNGTAAGTRRLTHFSAADPFAGSPLSATTLRGRLTFFADDGVHGREIWWTDGTPEGTRLLADACPGSCGTAGRFLASLPNFEPERLLFSAQGPDGGGHELWATDGTPGGTGLLSDLCPGPCSGEPEDFSTDDFESLGAIFTAATPEGGRALWFTDGTAQQTLRLTPPGATVTSFYPLAVSDADFGDELWTTDGTPAGTHLFRDLESVFDSGSHPAFLAAAGDRAVFAAFTPAHGYGLYASDGTAAGTVPIALPEPGPEISQYMTGTSVAGRAAFVAPVGGVPAVWATDGTTVERLTPPGVDANGGPWIVGGRLLFFAVDAEHGAEPWVSDGTPASTHLVADVVPGPEGIDGFGDSQVLHGQLLFGRVVGDTVEDWVTDGTPEGTRPLVDAYPFLAPFENSGRHFLAEASGKLYFSGASELFGRTQIWVSDWTAAGTHSLDFPSAGDFAAAFYPAGPHLFLTLLSYDPNEPVLPPLWRIDGDTAAVVPLPFDLNLTAGLGFLPPTPFGDRLVLGDDDQRLWVTDGTAAGTFLLHDDAGQELQIYEGRAVSFAGNLVTASTYSPDALYGFGSCYVWNGEGATAVRLEGLFCNGDFLPAGSRLYFSGFEPQTGVEPWVLEEK